MATATEYVESIRFKECQNKNNSEINKSEVLKMVINFFFT